MATALKINSDIKKLKKALESKGISASIKEKLKNQLEKAENELASIKKTGKSSKKSSTAQTKTVLSALEKLVNRKRYSVYKGAGVDLKKDAGESAMKTGKRISKGLKSNQWGDKSKNKGNVYYEYRPNRLDVKQPKKRQTYPKLEYGGMMAKGGKISNKMMQLLDAGFEFVIHTDYLDYFLVMAKEKGNLVYIVKKGKVYNSTKIKTFSSEQDALDYLTNKAGKKVNAHYSYADGGMMADGGEMDVVNTELIKVKGNLMGTTSLELKIKGMRKSQDFIVYPISADQAGKPITIQSDTRFGYLDLNSGRGLMSQSHANGAYSYHFASDKKVPFKISETDVQKIKEHLASKSGSKVGNRGIFSDNSGADKMASGGETIGFTIYYEPQKNLGGKSVQSDEQVRGNYRDMDKVLDKKIGDNYLGSNFYIGDGYGKIMLKDESKKKEVKEILDLFDFEDKTSTYKKEKGGYMDDAYESKEDFLDEIYDNVGGSVDVIEREKYVQLSTDTKSKLDKVIDIFSPSGKPEDGLVSKISEVEIDGNIFYYVKIAYPNSFSGGMMANGGMVSLSKHYKTLAKKDDLVGLRVYDENNDEYVYIKSVDGGIWAGKNKNDELGHYYDMSDLMVDQYANGGEVVVKVGDKVKQRKKVGSIVYGVDGEVYEVDGASFKLKDKYGNKSDKLYFTHQFKKSEIKSMADGGMLLHGFNEGDNILEIYKGYGIVENKNNGLIEVLNPNEGTRFIIDLDDSKSSGVRTSMGMSKSEQIESAKKYIDWLDKQIPDTLDEKLLAEGKMAAGGMMAAGGSIKDYYTSEFPTDELGERINPKATFSGLYKLLETNGDVYDYIGVGDSIIRERIFSKLADIKSVSYDKIYSKWLGVDTNRYMAAGGKLYGGFKIKIEKEKSPYNKEYYGLNVKVDKDGVPLGYVLQALVDFNDKAYLDKALENKTVQVFAKMYTRYIPLGNISKNMYEKYVQFLKNSNQPETQMEFGGALENENIISAKHGYLSYGGTTSAKKFNVQYNVGKSKYVINYHDGVKKHKDGSPFYDVAILKNMKDFMSFKKKLRNEGYVDMSSNTSMADGGYVAVAEKDGYWIIMSKPTTKEEAHKYLDGVARGEVGKVVTLKEAKSHKKIIGKEYLAFGGMMADGGMMAKGGFVVDVVKEYDADDILKYADEQNIVGSYRLVGGKYKVILERPLKIKNTMRESVKEILKDSKMAAGGSLNDLINLYYHKTSGGAEYLCSSKVKGSKDEGSLDSEYCVRIDGASRFGGELMFQDEKETIKLFYHKTSRGAEYLCSSKVEGTKNEGDLNSKYIVRIDNANKDGGELIIKNQYAAGGIEEDYSKQTSDDFELGEIVWDTDNKRYGTIIGIYDNYASDKYEVRLDSDGMQPTENLRKLGSNGDKGKKEQLNEAIVAYARLVKNYPKNNYPKQIQPTLEKGSKMAAGGMMADGGYIVRNLGGDRYDGGLAYEITKDGKVVQEGLLDGEMPVEFEGRTYDGLLALSQGLGAKIEFVGDMDDYAKGGKLKVGHKIKYEGKEGEILHKRGDLYFVRIFDYQPNRDWVVVLNENQIDKFALGGELEIGDEGMYEGGEAVITNVFDSFIEYSYLDNQGNPESTKKLAPKTKFKNQFRIFPKYKKGGYMAHGGGVGRIVMIPTYVVKEIKESVDMGYDNLVQGMIGRKRMGVMLVNKNYEVRGTYDIGLKDEIEELIGKIKSGNFKVDAVDSKEKGGYMAHGGQIKAGQYVIVDNPNWKAAMGIDKPVRRRVKMVDAENVFFSDGSNSSIQYVKKLEDGAFLADGGILSNTHKLA